MFPSYFKVTLPKFNSSPLKNDGWKTTFLLGWYIFRGYVKLPGGTCWKIKSSAEKRYLCTPTVSTNHLDIGPRPGNDFQRSDELLGKAYVSLAQLSQLLGRFMWESFWGLDCQAKTHGP